MRSIGFYCNYLRPRNVTRKIESYMKIRNAAKQVESYMKQKDIPYCLHLGCGRNLLSGWLNTDIEESIKGKVVCWDATKKYPLADNSIDYIFLEHMFEHLSMKDAVCLLSESKRVLKEGGVIRITLPDMQFLLDLYSFPEKYKTYLKWEIEHFLPEVEELFPGEYPEVFVINNFYRDWGHQVIYDYKTLEMLLRKCGYKNLTRCEVGKSEHAVLRNIEGHDTNTYPGLTKLESMIVEATV